MADATIGIMKPILIDQNYGLQKLVGAYAYLWERKTSNNSDELEILRCRILSLGRPAERQLQAC